MSYLSKLKLKKISKLKQVFKAGECEALPDSIFVKPAKKSHLIIWASEFSRYGKLTDEQLEVETNIIGIEKSFYQMILLSTCLGDGNLIGNPFDNDDLEKVGAIEDHESLSKLFIAACEINRIDKKLAKSLCGLLDGLFSMDFDLDKLEDEPKKRGRPRKK